MKLFPTSPALRKTSLREVCTSLFLSISLRSTSILSIPANIFLIWSTPAGYEEIAGGFEPTRNGETFQMNNNYVYNRNYDHNYHNSFDFDNNHNDEVD